MADPYVGEIRVFAGNFAPRDWALCDGSLVSIQQNSVLFSILGTTYGGDGKTTFALPNFMGAAPIHQGSGAGLTPRTLGESGGSQAVTLITTELPYHTHSVNAQTTPTQADPAGAIWASSTANRGQAIYSATPNVAMSPLALNLTGGSQPHNNMQPFVAMNFIIALQGVYPPKP
ncbi:hypothetical protein PAECIP111893_04446 [Paenibacillus plantiphilus]|uniref:Phage tail collar domain-containing protein n=1 Tax=Paenibacillus plantiphilus TaxID=2905650 RepID=A0ABM9CME7_9BACL|nr:tail fiber protein [Paenibacillus plantiphilus]CAH1218566.1 hypothetical protein PAECIP111893_04446 [Paenibacillus plantiphilus]